MDGACPRILPQIRAGAPPGRNINRILLDSSDHNLIYMALAYQSLSSTGANWLLNHRHLPLTKRDMINEAVEQLNEDHEQTGSCEEAPQCRDDPMA